MYRAIAAALIVFAALTPFCVGDESSGGTPKYFFVNGAKLYTESFGHGAPMLFLHGGLMFFDSAYAKQRDYFAANHLVIGIDQRGHGRSPDGPWQLSYQLMADDTAAVLQQLKVGPVDVVGHSDGGNIALLLARDHPELVRRIVVSGANLRGWSAEEFEARKRMPPAELEEKVRKLANSLPPSFRTDYGSISPDGLGHWMTMLTKCYWLWGTPVVIAPGDLNKIHAPVLVMAGDHDLISLEQTTEIFRSLPHGQLFLVPGTGHGTFQTRSELVNLAMSEFLNHPDDKAALQRSLTDQGFSGKLAARVH